MLALGRLKLWGLAVLGALLALLAVFMKGQSLGRKREEIKNLREDIKTQEGINNVIKATKEAESAVSSLPESDVRKRLQDRWSRD